MKRRPGHFVRGQGGYTLIELIVSSAIAMIVVTGLSSVVLTSYQAWTTASSRVETSSQIRNFQFVAYDDFAGSALPSNSCTVSTPCSQPIVLSGERATNSTPPAINPYKVTYSWDGATFLDRQIEGGSTRHVASGVTAFSWYVQSSTVVVSLTIKVQSYSQSQFLRFYPRLQS